MPLFYYFDDDHYSKLKERQDKPVENNDTLKEHTLIPVGSTVAVQREYSRPWVDGTVTVTTWLSADPYLRDHILKKSNTYICRDVLYRHYEPDTSLSRVCMLQYDQKYKDKEREFTYSVTKAMQHQTKGHQSIALYPATHLHAKKNQ